MSLYLDQQQTSDCKDLTKKYAPPPLTSPLVQIAQVERAVIVVTKEANNTIELPITIPA